MILSVVALAAGAAAQSSDRGSYYEELISSMGIDQKIGAKAAFDAKFTDENGHTVTIGELTKGRPLLLLPTYYTGPTTCPMLTDDILMTLARTTKEGSLVLGRDLEVAMIGINPNEGPQQASQKKLAAVNAVMEDTRAKSSLTNDMGQHWTVLTGSLDQIRKLTDSVGFRYRYDAKTKSVDYPTGTVLLTADGTISAYTVGNDLLPASSRASSGLQRRESFRPRQNRSKCLVASATIPVRDPIATSCRTRSASRAPSPFSFSVSPSSP